MQLSDIIERMLESDSCPCALEHELDRRSCETLLSRSFAMTDFGRALESLKLYSPTFNGQNNGEVMDFEGKRQALTRRQANLERRTRHVVSNYLFRLLGSDTACSLSLVTLYLCDDTSKVGTMPLTVADCAEGYTRDTNGHWLIERRYLMSAAGAPR